MSTKTFREILQAYSKNLIKIRSLGFEKNAKYVIHYLYEANTGTIFEVYSVTIKSVGNKARGPFLAVFLFINL